jgi:3-oxoacyl-[acyl-carrier protein] reductase
LAAESGVVLNKTALLTGVSRGLGLAIARRLLEGGWTVCGTSRTPSAEWKALAAAHPGRAEWRACDLAAPENVEEQLFGEWLPTNRPVHAFVNNAAMAYDDLVTNVRVPRLAEMFAVNVLTPIALTRAVIRNMLFHSTRGAMVHVSSISVHAGAKGLAMYAATKGALEAFSKNTAREWGERGIRSNCVVPGYMDTEMTATLSEEQKAKIHRRASLKRATDVRSVAATVAFLLSDDAASITGQNVFVDGGMI